VLLSKLGGAISVEPAGSAILSGFFGSV